MDDNKKHIAASFPLLWHPLIYLDDLKWRCSTLVELNYKAFTSRNFDKVPDHADTVNMFSWIPNTSISDLSDIHTGDCWWWGVGAQYLFPAYSVFTYSNTGISRLTYRSCVGGLLKFHLHSLYKFGSKIVVGLKKITSREGNICARCIFREFSSLQNFFKL